MTGSEKQINWASEILVKFNALIDDAKSKSEKYRDILDKYQQAVNSIDKAADIISGAKGDTEGKLYICTDITMLKGWIQTKQYENL